jgi:hypothetical protein
MIDEEVCEGRECRFEARRSRADRASERYFLASSMPYRGKMSPVSESSTETAFR